MKIIGITSDKVKIHDNSVALLEDGKILFAEAQERLSRKKHDGNFPNLVIQEALNLTGNKIKDIDYFVTADPKPSLFKTLLSTLQYIPTTGLDTFFEQVVERFKFRRNKEDLELVRSFNELKIPQNKIIDVSHYLAHGATAYYFSPFRECLVVTMDGYGLDSDSKPLSGKIYLGEGGRLTQLEDIPVHGSLGLYYGAVTIALGFKLNDGEGKTMGLAAYGNPQKSIKQITTFFPAFKNGHWTVRKSIFDILNISRTEVFIKSKTYKFLIKLIARYGRENVAAGAQEVFEKQLENYFKYLAMKYQIKKVSAAGGIFLNMKANMRLLQNKIIDELFVYPNPGDSGTAIGASVAGFLIKKGKFPQREIKNTNLGRAYSEAEIKQALMKTKGITYKKLGKDLAKFTAGRLNQGKVLGWFQGRGEWGPRALGQRSVIADPRKLATKNRINAILKGREWFMPFAPSILEERASDYLVNLRKAPFMIIGDDVTKLGLKELRAIVHVDGTVRPHIVSKKVQPLYYQVIKEFEKLTGVGVILNTSFNKHGLPIVYSPQDALNHLLWGAIDELVIGQFHVVRKNGTRKKQ